jgi:photosystem II stability/assembly factor-like uncharacterized protein
MKIRSLLPLLGPSLLIGSLALMNAPLPAMAQSVSPLKFNGLQWRLVGPFRAGRVVAVSGVPGSDRVYYFGGVDGGVWKTTDAGTVWKPVFDHEPVASIGAIAVAPSDPRTVYVGTGESDIRSDLASGDGVYKSTDGGKTWTHIGLTDSQQISGIVVDPQDANTVYVGVLGHAYGPNAERGVYKTTDGGAHWTRVLYVDPSVGIADIAMAAAKPQILFATTWNAHRPPWIAYPPVEGPGDGLWRTTDGGAHWTQVSGHGLPAGEWGRTGVTVSADGQRVYATITCKDKAKSGLYRSDDGGATWRLVNNDPRLTSRAWYFMAPTIDPKNPDVVYIPNVALYRTEDGGKTIQIVRGAPGGDDYHVIWVDPKDPNHLVLGVDQGATVSVDGGKTWTTWYNQPTAQMYHVTTDHRFPYDIYGAQQDSGSIAVKSRTDHGHIDMRDWFLPGGSEAGYIAIDPKDENIVYFTDTYGDVERHDMRTAFSQNITPWPLESFGTPVYELKYRDPWTPVLVFSPADKTTLYLGTQYVMKTTDGGLHWERISGDLTGAVKGSSQKGPASPADAEQRGYGVVYTIAPSPLDAKEIWAGSDTGLIHLTLDGGKTWKDVTPPGITAWSKISLIEADRFDAATAYAAVDRHRLGDRRPYIYITHDYGKTWKLSVKGIGPHDFLRAVRQDTVDRNLLFAGTEFGVYVSFDDGGQWQPLQLNLPVTSVRDLAIHDSKLQGSDLIAATHGRSFWVLDDIAALRQAAQVGDAAAYLYKPGPAVRVDNDEFLGTPLPPEEPQAKNPPDGAIVDYYLKSAAEKVTLQILNAQGQVVRHFASGERHAVKRPLLPIAERWFPKPQVLETTAGEHRFVWNLTASGPGKAGGDDDMGAMGVPSGPRVPPGAYTLKLTVDGKTMEQPLRVTMDPRSSATKAVLEAQYALASEIDAQARRGRQAMAELQGVESQIAKLSTTEPSVQGVIHEAQAKLEAIRKGTKGAPGLEAATSALGVDEGIVESGDRTAPAVAVEIFHEMGAAARKQIAAWEAFKKTELPALNAALKKAHRKPVEMASIEEQVYYAMTR